MGHGGAASVQYIYYNRLIGGIAGAEWHYGLDYWGAALHRAADELHEYVANERGGRLGPDPVKVFVCGHPTSVMYFLPDQFQLVGEPEKADFLVSWTQAGCNFTKSGQVVAEVNDRRRGRAGQGPAGVGRRRRFTPDSAPP